MLGTTLKPKLFVLNLIPFFTRLEETLVTYLMLILGLQSAQATSDEEHADQPTATPEGRKVAKSKSVGPRGRGKNEGDAPLQR